MDRTGLFASNMALFENSAFRAAGFAFPMRSRGTLAAGIYQLSSGEAEQRDDQGNVTGSFKNQESLMRLAFGRSLSRGLALGGSLDYMKMSLADSAHGFASFNVGAAWQPQASDLRLALAASNLVSKVQGDTSDRLPLGLKASASYALIRNVAALSLETDIKPSFAYQAGLDWALCRFLSLRLGRNNDFNGIGLGLNLGKSIHLAYTANLHDLGMVNQMTLSMEFGKGRTLTRREDALKLYDRADAALEKGTYSDSLAALCDSESFLPLPADRRLLKDRLSRVVDGGVENVSGLGDELYLLRRGVGFFVQGNEDMARTSWQAVLAKRPQHPAARRLMALLPPLKTQEIAIQQKADFTDSDPVKLKLYQIQKFFQQKDYSLALKECQELLVLNPREVMAYVRMGSIYWTMGLKKDASKAWNEARRLAPNHPEVLKAVEFMKLEGMQ
jgi:tetratricopeptide (TPR) repeat protein